MTTKKPTLSAQEQHRRFVETARELGCDEDAEALDRCDAQGREAAQAKEGQALTAITDLDSGLSVTTLCQASPAERTDVSLPPVNEGARLMPAATLLLKTAQFGPDVIAMLDRVFDDAWATIELRPQDHPETLRLVLAEAIIDLARAGQLDPDKLEAYALRRVHKEMGSPII